MKLIIVMPITEDELIIFPESLKYK